MPRSWTLRSVVARLAVLALGALALGATGLAVMQFVFARAYQPRSALARAAAAGDAARVQALAGTGAAQGAVDAPDAAGFSALDWAARNGRVEAIEALVAAGADPDGHDHGFNGWTPVMHAVHKRQAAAVEALLALGADPNRRSGNGDFALLAAAMRGDLPIVRSLLAAGADPLIEAHGRTTLTNAVWSGNPDVVRALRQRAPGLRLRNTFEDHVAAWIARLTGHGDALAAAEEPVAALPAPGR
jgi:ankyrin repeat protein